MMKAMPRVRQVKARALETSAILLAVMVAGPAFAQCTPDPTQSNATTTCTGTDSNGLKVTTSATTVSCPLLSGPSTMTVWIKEGTTNAFEEAQARGDYREAA
ncbi:hypothetical protein [Sphingomonas parapaucimobilis]|jgi:hypothetical protein